MMYNVFLLLLILTVCQATYLSVKRTSSGSSVHIPNFSARDGPVTPPPPPPPTGPMGGNFMPLPPPIPCDDFNANNGIGCIYLVSNASHLVTPLVLGNVTMPSNNPTFTVNPPKEIGPSGAWFSFRTLLNWTNTTDPIVPWQGVVQYSAKDAEGITYIFQTVMTFGGGAVDIGFDFPQHHGIDVGPEVEYHPSFAIGFQIVNKGKEKKRN